MVVSYGNIIWHIFTMYLTEQNPFSPIFLIRLLEFFEEAYLQGRQTENVPRRPGVPHGIPCHVSCAAFMVLLVRMTIDERRQCWDGSYSWQKRTTAVS